MAEKLTLRTNSAGDIYVYMEDASGDSMAVGSDTPNNVFALNVATTANVLPDEPTATMAIEPGANGNITFRPHGTGDTFFDTGDVDISAGKLNMPVTNATLTEGVISLNNVRYFSAYDGTDTNSNVFLGYESGPDFGPINGRNVGVGYRTLNNNANGSNNTVIGWSAGVALSSGNNTLMGSECASSLASGISNVLVGVSAGAALSTASFNTIIGAAAATGAITAERNVVIGYDSDIGDNAHDNIVIGHSSGSPSIGSSNILLSNVGVVSENNTLRLGTTGAGNGQQTRAFIAGIHGVTPAAGSQQLVIVNDNGQMGTTTGGSFTTNTYNTDSGSATPSAGAITIAGGSNLGTTGAGSTVTVNLDNDVSISGSYTTTGGNINLPATNTTLTQGAIFLDSLRFMHARGDDNVFIGSRSGNTTFTISGSGGNVAVGSFTLDAMTTNARSNVAIGANALTAATDARGNTAVGAGALVVMTTQLSNTAIGQQALTAATSGDGRNTGIGNFALGATTTGSYNVALGNVAGSSLTGANSSNVMISNTGTAGDSNTIRIGTQGTGNGQQNRAFMAGVYNTTPAGGNDGMVYIDSNGQLGSQVNLVMPENPAFLAYNSITDTNQTGAGALVTVQFNAEVFDQGGDFSSNTFTAPVTGKYLLTTTVTINDLTAAMTLVRLDIVTSNATYYSDQFSASAGSVASDFVLRLNNTVIADMDAGDTAIVQISASNGGGNTAGIVGTASPLFTRFSGSLVC